MAAGPSGGIPIPYGYIANQNVTIGSEADSAALNSATRLVRLKAEAACKVRWGAPEQTAATGDGMLMDAGETEYVQVDSGDEVSVIA
jgi:hypothetical protein